MKAITAARPGRRFREGRSAMCSSPEPIQMFSEPPNAGRHSVCTTAQSGPCAQRRGRYLPEPDARPAKKVPAIAAQAVAVYTKYGDLVVDLMWAIGTGLVVVPLARVLAAFSASTARVITACAVPNDPDADPIAVSEPWSRPRISPSPARSKLTRCQSYRRGRYACHN